MTKIEFTKSYATKKKGDVIECDGMIASTLVRDKKVAKYFKEKETKQ